VGEENCQNNFLEVCERKSDELFVEKEAAVIFDLNSDKCFWILWWQACFLIC
jgi:hypothetical protein